MNNNNLNFYLLSITSGIQWNDIDLVLNSLIKYKLELSKIINYKYINNNNNNIIISNLNNSSSNNNSNNNTIISNLNNNSSNNNIQNHIIIDSEIIPTIFRILSINNNSNSNSNSNNNNDRGGCGNNSINNNTCTAYQNNNIHSDNNNNNSSSINKLYQLKIEASKLLFQVIRLLNIEKTSIINIFKQISNHCNGLFDNSRSIEFNEVSCYLTFFKGIEEYLGSDDELLLSYCKSLECLSKVSKNEQDVLLLLKSDVLEVILKILYNTTNNEIQELCLKFVFNLLNNDNEIDIQKLIDMDVYSRLMLLLLNFFNDKTCLKLQTHLEGSGCIEGSGGGSIIGGFEYSVFKISQTQDDQDEESIIITGRSTLKKIVLLFCSAIKKSNLNQLYYFDQMLTCYKWLQIYLFKYQFMDQFVTYSVIDCLNYMSKIIYSRSANNLPQHK